MPSQGTSRSVQYVTVGTVRTGRYRTYRSVQCVTVGTVPLGTGPTFRLRIPLGYVGWWSDVVLHPVGVVVFAPVVYVYLRYT